MDDTKDVVTIHTNIGYAKVSCTAQTTVKAMIITALRTVSISSPSQLYGLYWSPSTNGSERPRYLLCRSLTWCELKELYNPTELTLSICLYPTKFEKAARSDRSTLFYLHQQAKELYYRKFDIIKDAEMAFEIGCLEIRSIFPNSPVEPKELLEIVEKVRTIQSFFPPCVLQQNKTKLLRRSVQNRLLKLKHYSEEDCVLDMLNRYLMLLHFDREIIRCSFGAGYGIPAELVIGPRYQVSIKIENARQPRLLAYFASIRHVLVSTFTGTQGERYQVRLAIEPSPDPNARLEIITFTFDTRESADTVVHLLDGYCGESVGAVLQDCSADLSTINANQSNLREDFLPNGCPYRLREESNAVIQRLELSRNCVILEQVLGEGQFGDVYKGSYIKYPHADPLAVAIKTCKPECSAEDRKQFLEEARILGEFNHPHIIRLIGVCSSNPIWLVMEYAPLGELRHYLLANQSRVPLSLRVTFCYQIVTALTCLEDRKCVHRDIAARNILVARKDWVKIADFGMARMLNEATEFQAEKGRKMPIKWMPPESIHERRFSLSSDVWMFGVCMWEILSGGIKPFSDMTNAEAADLVTRGQRLKRPPICPPHLYILMLECWSTNPMRRPRFSVLKPRLREMVAQTSNGIVADYLNEDPTTPPESSDNRTLANHSPVTPCRSSPAGFANHKYFHSQWNEVTELEDIGRQTFPRASSRSQKLRLKSGHLSEENGHVSRRVGHEQSSPQSDQQPIWRQQSPKRSPTRVTFIQSSRTTDSRDERLLCSKPRAAPDISREPSPRRKTVPTLHLDEFISLDDPTCTERPKSEGAHASRTPITPCTTPSQRNGNNNRGLMEQDMPVCFENHYENESPEDRIYTATVHVVQTVRLVSQQLTDAPPERYTSLAKNIGTAVKDLFVAVEDAFGTGLEKNEIFLAERQLNASMYHLISTIRDANLWLNRGPLQEEFRRHLMTLSYVVANDAHSLYSAVHDYRMRSANANRAG